MNTKAHLQWWIEFSQKDLGRIKNKTREKLYEGVCGRVKEYCSFWGATPSDSIFYSTDVEEETERADTRKYCKYLLRYQEGAAAFVRNLNVVLGRSKNVFLFNRGSLGLPSYYGIHSVDIKFSSFVTEEEGGEFSSFVSVETEPHNLIYFFMSMLMMGTKREDFKNCAYCGKLFLQVSREKKFCTRNCAANSAKG